MSQILLFAETNTMGYGKSAGAYKLATELRSYGYEVQVVDNYTNWSPSVMEKIINKFVDSDTLWVGFSTTFSDKRKGRFAKQHPQRDLINKILSL